MVSRLLRALSAGTENEPARAVRRDQASASWRQLEIALRQFADNGAQFERARVFVQRSRLPDRLRMRLRWIGRSAGDVRKRLSCSGRCPQRQAKRKPPARRPSEERCQSYAVK